MCRPFPTLFAQISHFLENPEFRFDYSISKSVKFANNLKCSNINIFISNVLFYAICICSIS